MPYVKQQPVPLADSWPITLHGFALGRELRKTVITAGFTQAMLAAKLGMSESRVSRMMTGRHPVTVEDTAAILAVCGVNDERRELLLSLTRAGSIAVLGARQQRSLMGGLQIGAGTLVDCCSLLLPAMVWTRDYAEEVLIRSVGVNDDQAEDQIAGLVDARGEMTIDLGNTLTGGTLRTAGLRGRVAAADRAPPRHGRTVAGTVESGPRGNGCRSGWCRSRRARTLGMRGSFSLVQQSELTVITTDDAVHVRFYDDPARCRALPAGAGGGPRGRAHPEGIPRVGRRHPDRVLH